MAAIQTGLDLAKVSPQKMWHSLATALGEQGRSSQGIVMVLCHDEPVTTAI